jgi:putative hydrolase of the HAD superfamily
VSGTATGGTAVRHVLLDADGVLQFLPGGWVDRVEPYLGARAEEFMRVSWTEERPALAGEADFLELLQHHLHAFGVDVPADELHRTVWRSIETVPGSIELVHRIRAAGYGVHLGTNQEYHRAAHMRSDLGYDELFDVSCYSYELGVVKPDPRYFTCAAGRIGVDPGAVVFVDDLESSVAGAREAGMAAVHWTFDDGLDVLERGLAEHGVQLG